jgi:peptide/nickel transport system substrate-binding protein
MFHMVGYTRVGNRLDFTPNISINSWIPIEQIKFK